MTEDLNKQSVSFPAVSIITPTWNRKGLLAEAIESVRCQTATNWEHLIIDDGSSDGSREMVEALSAADSRIIWLPRDGEKDGANVCRNQGLRKSRGDYIVFLDSDDLLEPGCLERRVGLMRRNLDLDFAVFQTGFFVEKIGDRHQQEPGEIFGDDLLRILCFELPWIITAPIWRRETLKSLGGFDENLPSWQDIDLHLRAVAEDKKYLKFSVLDHHVRWHLEETRIGIQQRTSADHLMAADKILAKFEDVVRNGPGMDWCRQRALCGLYFFVAECWIGVGRLEDSLRCWRQVKTRRLGPSCLHHQGHLLLRGLSGGVSRKAAERLIPKWKGWMRFRGNPELVAQHVAS